MENNLIESFQKTGKVRIRIFDQFQFKCKSKYYDLFLLHSNLLNLYMVRTEFKCAY